jgi:hypothetical protein
MSVLKVKDKIGLGQLIVEATANDELRAKLLADANSVLGEFVDIPEGHTIKVIPPQKEVTTLMLPLADDVSLDEAEVSARALHYPSEYDPNSPDFIDPAREPSKALQFRIGDYILARCR